MEGVHLNKQIEQEISFFFANYSRRKKDTHLLISWFTFWLFWPPSKKNPDTNDISFESSNIHLQILFSLKSPWNHPLTPGVDPRGWPLVALGHKAPPEELARARRALSSNENLENLFWHLNSIYVIGNCKTSYGNLDLQMDQKQIATTAKHYFAISDSESDTYWNS